MLALYQAMLVDHGRHPRHFYVVEEAQYRQEGANPLCGDRLVFHVYGEGGVLKNVGFQGEGCAICMASASLMSEMVEGMTLQEFHQLFDTFHRLVRGECVDADLGKLAIFSNVSEYPTRVKCATLAWHTLRAAMKPSSGSGPVTTEE